MSQDHWDKDIIIWPETALPIFPESIPDVIATLNKRGAETKTDLLVGAPTRDHLKKKYYNSLLQLGNSLDQYSKRNLVPYGEYFPGKSYFKFFEKYLMIPMSDLSPGSRLKDSFLLKGHQVGILICYEVAFTDVAFSSLPKSKILVNVSNDAWFGNSIAPFQHLQIARVRALESGRPLVRATNTGLTALIDHKGAVLEKAPQFVPAVVSGTIHARTGVTPYVEYRNVPALSLSIFVTFFFLQNIFRRIVDLNH